MTNWILPLLCFVFFLQNAHAQQLEHADGDLLPQIFPQNPPAPPSSQTGNLVTIPAGDAIEGDYIGEMKFTRNGSQVWVLNRATDNITVIDWASRQIVQDIPVGSMPMDIDFSDHTAVVACYGSNEVWFINLADYSVAAVQPVAEQPAKVVVSRPGNLVAIGCDGPDVAELFSLNTYANFQTISGFPVYLAKFSFITSNPRNSVYYSNFRFTDDELFLVNSADEAGLKFWDISSGEVVATVPQAGNCSQIELSADGSKIIAMRAANPGVVTQVDAASQTFAKQITLNDVSIFSTYSPPAVNADGSKVLVPTNPGNTALLNFTTETWQHLATGNTPDWVGSSPDGSHLIAGDFYLAVIDPTIGSITSSLNGISIQNGAVGAGNRIVASDPLRYESLVFYEFANPSDLNLTGSATTGSELEADATYSVKFTPDGQTLLAVNSLSGSLSVIDVEGENLEAIIPLGSAETFHVDVTSDSRYALIAKRLEDRVAIIDLQTNTVVADVSSGGDRPDQVFVLPGDAYAYAINAGGGDNIGVIALDGANSSLETAFAIGNTGISWTNYGIRSDLDFTPDGTQALLACPFDEQVQVIDLENHAVVATVPVEGFPLQIAIAPHPDFGNFAAVTLKNADELAILAGQGSNWSLVGTYPCYDDPVRVEYDPASNAMWVVSSSEGKVQQFSLETLQFVGEGTYATITPIGVRIAENGRRFTLTRSSDAGALPHQLEVSSANSSESYDLAALPIHHFDITPDGLLAAVAHPATDEVSLLKETPLGFEVVTLALSEQPYLLFPIPVREALHFRLRAGFSPAANVGFRLFAGPGNLVFEKQLPGGGAFSIPRQGAWPSGPYFYEMTSGGQRVQSGKIVFE